MDIDDIDDRACAAAFRQLVMVLRTLDESDDFDLLGLAGFDRSRLAVWLSMGSAGTVTHEAARAAIFQSDRLRDRRSIASLAADDAALDEALDDSFPASDPPSRSEPGGGHA